MEQIILFATGVFVVIGFIFVPIKAASDMRKNNKKGGAA